MKRFASPIRMLMIMAVIAHAGSLAFGQEKDTPPDSGVQDNAKEVVDRTQEKAKQLASEVDESEEAQKASKSVIQFIYALAEHMSFPAFHWAAFALMTTGVVSFALQLVLGKLVVLFRAGFSFTELLSDALGLLISLVGLVLTTQAATENSTFTESAFAVLSATASGCVLGVIFYVWGQRRELEAVRGRRKRSS